MFVPFRKKQIVVAVALAIAAMSTGCSVFRGLTIDSTQAECEAKLTESVQKFCETAKTNIDKIKGAEAALK